MIGTNCSGIQSNVNAGPPAYTCNDGSAETAAVVDCVDWVEDCSGGALVGVGGVVVVMYGLSSCVMTSGTFCAVSDHGGLGFHWSMKSVGSALEPVVMPELTAAPSGSRVPLLIAPPLAE